MKCDGSLASLGTYPTENGKDLFTSSFSSAGIDSSIIDSVCKKMVPCSVGSPPPFQTYGKSDSNGNNIQTNEAKDNHTERVVVTELTSQVTELQHTLVSLQQETEQTINKLRQELADKASIVESLQQQIRMKMILNLAGTKPNPVLQALAEFQGNQDGVANSEDILSSWRKNLELLGGVKEKQPLLDSLVERTPGSPNTTRSTTPQEVGEKTEGHATRPCATPSEFDRSSPVRHTDLASPGKEEGVSPTPSPVPVSMGVTGSLPCSTPTLVPKSFANSVGSPLSVNPMFSNRIPKEDPLEERLHEMLRYNMEKFAGQPIDTLADSRRVRELLSVHNIGQRLFAKYVLGLSQGTVSELLSKPKSWDKLTEKGRDSYRKMHAWVWDDQAILLLKTLIPRKGELLKSSSSKQEVDDRSDDRINKILSEVNKSPDNQHKQIFPHPEYQSINPGMLLPGLPSQSPEDLKLALSLYQAEINNMQRIRQGIKPEEMERENLKEEKENQEKEDKSPFSTFLQQAKLDPMLGLRQQHSNPGAAALFPPGFSVDSPLQRMASITNSLISQPLPSPNFSQRPLKAVLPPITQQQFDMFSHLNTDDVVRRTKEILSQYSISQRLFGEAVLGLSQGSVSDLLARPKPWHMLTQKGREPFIRMKLFLDDDSAIHKLVASQYKILPDKLLRTGQYSGAQIPMNAKITTSHPQFRGIPDVLPALIPNAGRLPPGLLPGMDRSMLAGLQQRQQQLSTLPHLTPNLYEMAALTQELDTVALTNKVKEVLLANNLGQKLFGEAVLGLSQGSVSEILGKPKPWHSLSIKGREPFVRMQMWLNDPTSIDKLTAIRKLQEETRKRKRTYEESYSGKSSPSDVSDIYSNPGGYEREEDREISVAGVDAGVKRMRDAGGLDLSFKRDDATMTEDGDGAAGDDVEDGQDENENLEDSGSVGKLMAAGAAGGGRSRRKPLAPQWLNPGWGEGDADKQSVGSWPESRPTWEDAGAAPADKDARTINGVCVVNSAVFNKDGTRDAEN